MPEDADTAMRLAVDHHRAGRLDEAGAAYERVLAVNPANADAWHLLGVVHLQKRDFAAAEAHLDRALDLRPGSADFLVNYATLLLETGRPAEAEAAYHTALAGRPDDPTLLHGLGTALMQAGKAAEAAACFRSLIAREPGNAPALMMLGLATIRTGDPAKGLAHLRAAADAAPSAAEPAYNLALALFEAGETVEALAVCDRVLALVPGHPGALNVAAMIRSARGELAEARALFDRALAAAPGFPDALVGLGNLERIEGDLGRAEDCFRRALDGDPRHAPAHLNLGNALTARGDHAAAVAAIRSAVDLDPSSAGAWNSLGVASAAAGDRDAAELAFDRAIALSPDHADARMGRAILRLSTGRFATGWEDYLHRDSVAPEADRLHRERLPADLAGRHILVVRDQGLGDELFFLRYAPALRARGARVTCQPDPRLAAMLARSDLFDAIAEPSAAPPDAGRVAVGDLPFVLGVGDDDPPPAPFPIPPDGAALDDIRARLEACGPAPWIGVTWRAGTAGVDRTIFKQTPAAALAGVLAACRGTIVAVQRNPAPGEIAEFEAALGRPVADFTALNPDLEAMLALMGRLDAYVGVSNTNVHLRAAGGRPSYVLVPNPPEFRWMAEGRESPWFPGSRVYRQTPDGGWGSAFAALARDLREGS